MRMAVQIMRTQRDPVQLFKQGNILHLHMCQKCLAPPRIGSAHRKADQFGPKPPPAAEQDEDGKS